MTRSSPLSGRPLICILLALASLGLLAFAFRGSLLALLDAWQTEEYSHGFMIPPLALLIARHRLSEYKTTAESSPWGVGLLVLAACLLLVGRLSAFEPPVHYGFLLALSGLCLAALGSKTTRVLVPALIYLVFAIPLPRLIYVALSQDLQLLSSTGGVLALDLFGIPVYQDGNIIDLGEVKLQIVEACSGLRYLFPLMSFGFLMALFLKDKTWKRVTVFLSTIPIAIVLNTLRIVFIGVTAHYGGKGMAEGFLHEFEGWAVFVLCLFILMGEIWLLLRIGPPAGRFRFDYFDFSRLGLQLDWAKPYRLGPVLLNFFLCLLLAVLFGLGVIDQRTEVLPAHPPLASFPLSFGGWSGRIGQITPAVLKELQASDYFIADYEHAPDSASVDLYMVYYESQRIQSSVHSPANCIPGGGWQVSEHQTTSVPLADGQSLAVSRLVIRRAGETELVYYWFDERGRDLTEQYGAKWYLMLDSIFLHRTDGALVRLVTRVAPPENEMEVDKRLQRFLKDVYPSVRQFIPGKNTDQKSH